MVSFAALLGLGSLLYIVGPRLDTLRQLSPVLSLYGTPALFVGLLLWRGVKIQRLAMIRMAGTSVSIVGVVVILAGVALAYQLPWALLVTGAMAFAVLTVAAIVFRIPAAHLPAAASLTLAYLTAWHVAAGRLTWAGGESVIDVLLSGASAVPLVPLSMFAAAAVAIFHRLKRADDVRWYGWITAGVAATSLALVTIFGFGRMGDPHDATWVYAIYAAAALVGAHVTGLRPAAIGGSLLMFAALLQGMVFDQEIHLAWPRALLAHATLATLIGIAWRRTRAGATEPTTDAPGAAMLTSAYRTSEAAALLLLLAPAFNWASFPWHDALWLAAAWFVLALHANSKARFAAGQAALTFAVIWVICRHVQAQEWFPENGNWLHPHVLQWLGTSAALLGLLWVASRLSLRRLIGLRPGYAWPIRTWRLSNGIDGVSVDRVVTGAVVGVAVVLGAGGVISGIYSEISAQAHVPGVHTLALGSGSWLLLAVLFVTLLAGRWERPVGYGSVAGAILLGLFACLLIAGRWSDQGSAASMLRWCLLGLLLAGSTLFWWRAYLARLTALAGWPIRRTKSANVAGAGLALLGTVTIAPVLCLTIVAFNRWVDDMSVGVPNVRFFEWLRQGLSYALPLTFAAGVMMGHAIRDRSRPCLYIMMLLLNAAATVWWVVQWRHAGGPQGIAGLAECLSVNVMALAVAGGVSLAIEGRLWRWELDRPDVTSPHRVAACLAVLVLGIVVVASLLADAFEHPLAMSTPTAWLALVAATALVVASLWDGRASGALFGLYTLGLIVIGLALDGFDLSHRWLLWAAALSVAGYTVLTSWLWVTRRAWLPWADRLRLPKSDHRKWLASATTSFAVVVTVVACWVVRSFSPQVLEVGRSDALLMRLDVAVAVLLAAVAVAMLARGIDRSALRPAALVLIAFSFLTFGLAWLTPGSDADTTVHVTVIVMTVLAVVIGAYGLGLVKVLPASRPWHVAAMQVMPYLFAAGAISLLTVLAAELASFYQNDGIVDAAWQATTAVIVTLIGLAALMLAFAMTPGSDPLNLSERGRMGYVYAAEAMLGLLTLHIRLTMPWLFRGFFEQYWPLIVMAIAFLGVGLSEWFARRGRLVLSRPLERTGVFLPLLPVLGVWVVDSSVDPAGLLVIVGLLYAILSIMRASVGFALVAALAANGSLWSLLNDTANFGFFEHPQMWMIPPALSVLVAAHLNRKRLTTEQTIATRYTCLMIIYISSTADIMINGIANSPWLPLVLMVLSVAGVMVGIMIRLRSYLYLGSAFLILSLLTMIQFASVSLRWTWLWYVAGIALGVVIIAVFALFEKNRDKVLHVIDDLKTWRQ